jgi:hypothetical protein
VRQCKGSNDRGDSILDERGTLKQTSKGVWETAGFSEKLQVSYQNNKMQLHSVGSGPRPGPVEQNFKDRIN